MSSSGLRVHGPRPRRRESDRRTPSGPGACQDAEVFRRRSQETRSGRGPRLSALTTDEVTWRDQQLQLGSFLVDHYIGETESPPTIEQLDRCVTAWAVDGQSRINVNTLVNGVGISFGEQLARAAQLEWVIATDAHGSDLALHGEPGDILIFPANAVGKRIAEREIGFVVELYSAFLNRIERRRGLG